MNELARKIERKRKTFDDLAKEVSSELKYTNGNFGEACDRVLNKEGVSNDFETRLRYKSAIGKILGEHSGSLKTKKPKSTPRPEQKPVDLVAEAYVRRVKKMQQSNPLFGEQIAKEEGLEDLEKKLKS